MKIMPYLVYPQIPRMPMQPSIPKAKSRYMSRKCAEKVHAHRNARTKASENRAAKKGGFCKVCEYCEGRVREWLRR